MFGKIDHIILQIGKWLSKDNRAVGIGFNRTVLAIGLPAAITFLFLIFFVMPQFLHEANSVHSRPFQQNIHGDHWYVAYEDREELLWKNKKLRDMYPHSQRLDKMPGQIYWIGIDVTAEQSANARRVNANQFLIGYFVGSWEVYVDSKLVKAGPANGYRRATIITIPEESFRRETGFRVTMRIRNDAHEMYPDTLFYSGLATEAQIETHIRWAEFKWMISNSITFGLNLALGLFFFALWLCGVRKQELSAFAAFGLLSAAVQALTMPAILDYLGAMYSYRLNFIIKIYEVILVLWLGASLARIRPAWLLIGLTIGLLAPWTVFLTDWSPNYIFHFTYFLSMWVSPQTYFVAAFLCFAQARLVAESHKRDLLDPARLHKLHLFWMALFLMGVVQLYGNQIYFDARILNAGLLLLLAAAVVHDYRRQELFIRRAPLSKYHQLAKLPERVPCILTTVDLKRSESLYRLGSLNGVGGAYVAEIISMFYRSIVEGGGEVLQTEGDSITFFFER